MRSFIIGAGLATVVTSSCLAQPAAQTPPVSPQAYKVIETYIANGQCADAAYYARQFNDRATLDYALTCRPAPALAVPRTSAPCGNGPTQSRLLRGGLELSAGGNPYESDRAQDLIRQGLAQQSQFDEDFARCLRLGPTN